MSDLDKAAARVAEQFAKRFGRQPKWIAAAPGRVNLIGEHIDYNDGFVLPMAIERFCVLAADAGQDGIANVFSAATDEETTISLTSPRQHASRSHWSNY